jgi:hypothetical protein
MDADEKETRKQLVDELAALRKRVKALEPLETEALRLKT